MKPPPASSAAPRRALENSNPKNLRLYERAGFLAGRNIAPFGAPPMLAMWRPRKTGIRDQASDQSDT